MAEGRHSEILADMGAEVRIQEARLTAEEDKEYGGWKRLGMALGHFADLVAQNEREATSRSGCWRPVRRCPVWSPGSSRSGDARAAAHRHAVARRASRLQHAGNDPQRIAGRHAGRGSHGPRAAAHAPRCRTRSADGGSARRDGRRPPDRSARAEPAGRLAHRAGVASTICAAAAGGVGAARPASRANDRSFTCTSTWTSSIRAR